MIENELLVSDTALKWLINHGTPVCSSDYIGYLFRAFPKVNGRVDENGTIDFYRIDKKPVTQKERNKYISKLIQTGFLYWGVEPFPEFSDKKHLPLDPSKTVFMEETLFKGEPNNGNGKFIQSKNKIQ